jgi:hypothetical protein
MAGTMFASACILLSTFELVQCSHWWWFWKIREPMFEDAKGRVEEGKVEAQGGTESSFSAAGV